jgi:putative FmdB family regulatory protein
MPIYAYRCDACGFEKDVLQKLSDAPLTQCPDCGKATFKKQVTAAGFQLKGSGWYATDFRDNKKPAGKEADKSAGKEAPKESAKDGAKDSGGATAGQSAGAASSATPAPAPAPAPAPTPTGSK